MNPITLLLYIWLVSGLVWLGFVVHGLKGKTYAEAPEGMSFTVFSFLLIVLPFMLILFHTWPLTEKSTLRQDVDACLRLHKSATVQDGKVTKCE